jgi:hypothetical protein
VLMGVGVETLITNEVSRNEHGHEDGGERDADRGGHKDNPSPRARAPVNSPNAVEDTGRQHEGDTYPQHSARVSLPPCWAGTNAVAQGL